MSVQIKHIIQKQTVQVEMENPPDAFWFRNRLSEVYQEMILPKMNEMFNEVAANRLIRLDRLEIDAGEIDAANWETDLTELTIKRLKQALLLEDSSYNLQNEMTAEQQDRYNFPSGEKRAEDDVKLKPTACPDEFYHFLKFGLKPWYSSSASIKDAVLHVFKNEKVFKDEFLQFLRAANEQQLLRLIYQLDENLLDGILKRLLNGEEQLLWKEVIHFRNGLRQSKSFSRLATATINKVIYLPVFSWLGSTRKDAFTACYAYVMPTLLAIEAGVKESEILQEVLVAITKDKEAVPGQIFKAAILKTMLAKPTIDRPVIEKKEKPGVIQTKEIFIENAGLVILHPFLSLFFKQINLLNEAGRFIDEAAQMKAILLTQYFVTGEAEFEEHALVLNKVLCGWPLENAVVKELVLTKSEAEEANTILKQVLLQWTVNGRAVNTSVDSLRQSFLKRNGKLTPKNYDFKLQVEQQPYDMVLSSLPWSIGVIKNSFMQGLLWVEWNY